MLALLHAVKTAFQRYPAIFKNILFLFFSTVIFTMHCLLITSDLILYL